MKAKWLLWLCIVRICTAIDWYESCKSVSSARAECKNVHLGTLRPNEYPVNSSILVYLRLENTGLVTLDADVFRKGNSLDDSHLT